MSGFADDTLAQRCLRKHLKHLSNHKDQTILNREAKRINAEVSWYNTRSSLEITVTAPRGFAWASTQEQTLEASTEKLGQDSSRELVSTLLADMAQGYKRLSACTGESECECQACEELDPEMLELDFG